MARARTHTRLCVPDDCDPEIKSRTVTHIYSKQHPVTEHGHFKEVRQTGRKVAALRTEQKQAQRDRH